MSTFLPLLALGALIVAAVFWVLAQSASSKLREAEIQLGQVQNELQELRDSKEQKATKEKNRKSEVEELREKVRDLKAKATEAQEQAQKAREAEKARRESEDEARTALVQARAEIAAVSAEAKAAREELSFGGKRARPAPAPAPAAPAKVEPPKTPEAAALESAAIATLETRLGAQHARLQDVETKLISESKKATDAIRELDRHKARLATSDKVYMVAKSDAELWKDRFRSLEGRFNKLMHELDALRRGVVSLEKRLPQAKVEEARAEAQAQTDAAWAEQDALQAKALAAEAADQLASAEAAAQLASAEAAAQPPEAAAEAKPN
jgi:chromosome segregation ATPase